MVAQPNLKRVNAQFMGDFVHSRFKSEYGTGDARSAHPTRPIEIQGSDLVLQKPALMGIDLAGNFAHWLNELTGCTLCHVGFLDHCRKPSILGSTKPKPLPYL
jgi:hypothetical protein